MKMKNYKIKVVEKETLYIYERAETKEEAVKMAMDDYMNGTFTRPEFAGDLYNMEVWVDKEKIEF